MSTFHSTIEITNNSDAVLRLNKSHSSGISSAFPEQLSNVAGQNAYKFRQGFDFQIKFKAYYSAPNGAQVSLEFYADGVNSFSQNIIANPSNAFANSEKGKTSTFSPTFVINGQAIAP